MLFSFFCFRYDSRVKAMEVDERPTEQYSDIGGLDSQIQEVVNVFNWIIVNVSYFKPIFRVCLTREVESASGLNV